MGLPGSHFPQESLSCPLIWEWILKSLAVKSLLQAQCLPDLVGVDRSLRLGRFAEKWFEPGQDKIDKTVFVTLTLNYYVQFWSYLDKISSTLEHVFNPMTALQQYTLLVQNSRTFLLLNSMCIQAHSLIRMAIENLSILILFIKKNTISINILYIISYTAYL